MRESSTIYLKRSGSTAGVWVRCISWSPESFQMGGETISSAIPTLGIWKTTWRPFWVR